MSNSTHDPHVVIVGCGCIGAYVGGKVAQALACSPGFKGSGGSVRFLLNDSPGGRALATALRKDGGLTLFEPSGARELIPCVVRSSSSPRDAADARSVSAAPTADGNPSRGYQQDDATAAAWGSGGAAATAAAWATFDAAEALRGATLVLVATKRTANPEVRAVLERHCPGGGAARGGDRCPGGGGSRARPSGGPALDPPTVVLLQNGLDAPDDFAGTSESRWVQ